jgi:hypothetical protein
MASAPHSVVPRLTTWLRPQCNQDPIKVCRISFRAAEGTAKHVLFVQPTTAAAPAEPFHLLGKRFSPTPLSRFGSCTCSSSTRRRT